MAGATSYVQDWINYWGRLGATFSKRIQSVSTDARAGKYGLDRAVSDTIALWADGYEVLCGALLGQRAAAGPPVVFFRITPGTEAKQRVVRVAVPGDAKPTVTALERVGGGADIPSPECVTVEVSDTRDELTVKLINLTRANRRGLPAGHYLGIVYADEHPVALVDALVV